MVEEKERYTPFKKKFYGPKIAGRKLANYIHPMLAFETKDAFDDPGWIFEIKWDGYRAIAETGDHTRLYSRNGNSFLETYPSITAALSRIKKKAILDGEIVVLDENGISNFQMIQNYENYSENPIIYYVFDLIELDGKTLAAKSLLERKKLLKKILGTNESIKYSDHVTEEGIAFFKAAIHKNLEGIMAKKADSFYQAGHRSRDWLKIKNHKSADVIIGGYTEPSGSRKYFGSLLLGIKDGNKLLYAGNAGTGYSEKLLREIFNLLQPLRQKTSPFSGEVDRSGAVTWVKPALICEVKFTEWTKDGKLRHPVFLQLRPEKSSKDITMKKELPVKAPPASKKKSEKSEPVTLIGKTPVKLSNTSKLYWPKEKVTKGMVIDYYQSIAKYFLPFLKDRPQSLLRNPNGILDKGFFHKDAGEGTPSWVKTYPVHSASSNKTIDYILCNNKETLAYLNNLGCIELNPWHSTSKKPDHPDYAIIDIDPSAKNTFDQVIETANHFNEVLNMAGAQGFCKTSGSTGLHIYIPMGKKYPYDHVREFSHLLCTIVGERLPAFTTLERNLKKRKTNHIYLDYLQNSKGQTIASVFSLRPREGAPVSMPLFWKEVKPGLSPMDFTIFNALKIIEKRPALFEGILGKGVDIKKCLEKLGA